MEFTRSSALAARFVALTSAGSTNEELAGMARQGGRDEWPEFSVVVTDTQTAGRGRLGRAWTAPSGKMLAISVLLWPRDAGITRPDSLGWLPLMAGLAMTRSVRRHGVGAELKWPNDVLVGDKKLCGILSELVSDGDGAVIVGAGVNLTLSEAALPVPTATSMTIEGGTASGDDVLADYLSELRSLYRGFAAAAGA
ncbi:MAG: biotin--[acetyl-CoA-carboxylase] ligase, partial [Humibacter sp.]